MTRSRPSALVTGASRGIGLALARRLALAGWDLTLSARDTALLTSARSELETSGAKVEVTSGDTADVDALAELIDLHKKSYGAMNALILAAGVGSVGPLENYPAKRLDKQLAVNLRAPFILVSQALPLLRAGVDTDPDRGGRIVVMSSLEGVHPEIGLSAYAASKAALISLVQSINAEEGPNGITASAVSPGFVATDMSAWTADTIPLETMIDVQDVVMTVDLILNLSRNAVLPHIVINRIGGGAYHA
jgi:NAD(P)-dependent dehydrogenase (short-subunit alcohol dehydrogenase family)